jgi:hypothetical protein
MFLSKPNRSRPGLLSSGLNFFAGFVTGVTFFYIHSSYSTTIFPIQHYDDSPQVQVLQAVPVVPVPPVVPVQVPPMEPSRPLPTEASRLQSIENRTDPLVDEEVFPKSMKNLVHRMGRVSREAFATKFDIGYGIDKQFDENAEVLILYGSERSLPTNYSMDGSTVVPHQRISDATENCDVMKVVVTNPKPPSPKKRKDKEHKEYIAIMGNWESYHVHKWKRSEGRGKIGLEYAPAQRPELPSREETQTSNSDLQAYLSIYEDAREKLRPLADKVARGGTTDGELGPIIVMVANHGQSQFFINFVCAAKSRGLDISRSLLFATDLEHPGIRTQIRRFGSFAFLPHK